MGDEEQLDVCDGAEGHRADGLSQPTLRNQAHV